jgi:hypothetical protein
MLYSSPTAQQRIVRGEERRGEERAEGRRGEK